MSGFLVNFDTFIHHLPFEVSVEVDTHDGFNKRKRRSDEVSKAEEEELALALWEYQEQAAQLLAELSVDTDEEDVLELDLKEEIGQVENVSTGEVFQLSGEALKALESQERILARLGALQQHQRTAILKSQQDLIIYLVAADLV